MIGKYTQLKYYYANEHSIHSVHFSPLATRHSPLVEPICTLCASRSYLVSRATQDATLLPPDSWHPCVTLAEARRYACVCVWGDTGSDRAVIVCVYNCAAVGQPMTMGRQLCIQATTGATLQRTGETGSKRANEMQPPPGRQEARGPIDHSAPLVGPSLCGPDELV